MLCVPLVRAAVVQIAVLPGIFATVHSNVTPSKNVTVPPDTEPTPGGDTVTVAVKVTDWPKKDGLMLEVSRVF